MSETDKNQNEQTTVEVVKKEILTVADYPEDLENPEKPTTKTTTTEENPPSMSQTEASVDSYYLFKEQEHEEILQYIQSAEEELADLKLRKLLIEADFDSLLDGYNQFIVNDTPISAIAKASLLNYFTYELLKPLRAIELAKVDAFNTWETKHFLTNYRVNDSHQLVLNFKMNVLDTRFETAYLPLIALDTKKMQVNVSEKDVLELIRLWHVEKIFSRNQLSLINYDLNVLLTHFKALGFEVLPNFLDNSNALLVHLTTQVTINEKILDDIFITTMEDVAYDFEKEGEHTYTVLLNQNQSVHFDSSKLPVTLTINSRTRKRSILDFFTHYPFLVPLIVES